MPGDVVEMKGHTVYINNVALKEDYTQYIDGELSLYRNYGPYQVPQGQYFAMGDNRDNSQDSRFWLYIPRDYLLGKALVIYWSFETPRDEYQRTEFTDRLKQYGDVLINFFTKTRWKRTFKIIR
jgi:signal peptidase I